MTATPHFGPGHPDAVRCKDCTHCPARPSKICEIAHRQPIGYGYWRKCSAYEPAPRHPPLLAGPTKTEERFRVPDWQIRGKTFDAFCDECWIVSDSSVEPAWAADEELAVTLFIRWLRQKRAEEARRFEIGRRRATLKTV